MKKFLILYFKRSRTIMFIVVVAIIVINGNIIIEFEPKVIVATTLALLVLGLSDFILYLWRYRPIEDDIEIPHAVEIIPEVKEFEKKHKEIKSEKCFSHDCNKKRMITSPFCIDCIKNGRGDF